MAKVYEFGNNPFQDYLLNVLLINVDISTKDAKKDLDNVFTYMLSSIYGKENMVYLDFEVKKKKDDHFKLVGKNFISALWLSCVFPKDIEEVTKDNFFMSGNKKYIFNRKKNKLSYSILTN